jgi:hypothetical protein
MLDRNTEKAPKLHVKGLGKGEMTVTDCNGHTCNVIGERNVFVRDVSCNTKPTNLMQRVTIDGSVPGVIHQIDGVLNFK